jgi:NADPH:quinone reductase-like Zn-dependent oxidoreductase
MRALGYDRYGDVDVLSIREVPVPSPARGEILVRVRAAALNPKDSFVRKGRYRALSGRRFPKYVGADFAGEVEAVGRGVRGFAVGDRVFGMLDEIAYRRGSVADRVVVRPAELGPMPALLSFEEAASLPLAALTALQALRDRAKVRLGDAVCIHGASGGVGSLAIQVARALGARPTTTSSAANLELCRSLGAEEALDYASEDAFSGERRYRVVFDVFGNLSLSRVRSALTASGVYVTTVPSARLAVDALRTALGYPRARLVLVRPRPGDLGTLRGWVEARRLRPVIDSVVPIDRALDAVRRQETKHARGKVVISLD